MMSTSHGDKVIHPIVVIKVGNNSVFSFKS